MRRAHFILPFKLCAKTFVYTETDDVIGTVTPYVPDVDCYKCKEGGKDQESIQSSATPYGRVTKT